MNEALEQLIATKDFAALNPAEQELVLAHMTEQEFESQRQVMIASQALFAEDASHLSPDPAVLHSLRAQMASKRKKKAAFPWLVFLWQTRMPVYQAGLLAVLLLFLYSFLFSGSMSQLSTANLVVDTIYVDKVVPVETIVEVPVETIKEVFVEVPVERVKVIEKPIYMTASEDIASSAGITPQAQKVVLNEVSKSFGNTSVRQEDLERFIVGL